MLEGVKIYYVAGKETEDLIVNQLREYFKDTSAYGSIFNKDFSILGESFKRNNENQPLYLISAGFPDRFRYFPNVLIKCAVQTFHRLDNDNLYVQKDEINQYGKRTVDGYIKGGHITLSVNATVRSLDQLEAEQVSDLLAFWSASYGWDKLKLQEAFIQPFTYPGGVGVENMKDSTDQKKIYRVNLSTNIRLSWIIEEYVDSDYITKVTVSQTDPNIDNI